VDFRDVDVFASVAPSAYNAASAVYTMSITLALCAMINVDPTGRRGRGFAPT
jgi:hypothetical protein